MTTVDHGNERVREKERSDRNGEGQNERATGISAITNMRNL